MRAERVLEHHKCCPNRFGFCRCARRLANRRRRGAARIVVSGRAPTTVALFGSGVPILALTTYLFTVIGALRYPEKINDTKVDYKTPGSLGNNLCNQLWSEWLIATGSLFIGSAVLVCGLGWALVSYADNLAVKLCETNIPIKRIEDGRKYFIRLNAWLSAAITTAASALLIVTNVLYLGGIGQQYMHTQIFLFFVYLFGLYLSAAHRMSFLLAHKALCVRTRNRVRPMAPVAHLSPQITKA